MAKGQIPTSNWLFSSCRVVFAKPPVPVLVQIIHFEETHPSSTLVLGLFILLLADWLPLCPRRKFRSSVWVMSHRSTQMITDGTTKKSKVFYSPSFNDPILPTLQSHFQTDTFLLNPQKQLSPNIPASMNLYNPPCPVIIRHGSLSCLEVENKNTTNPLAYSPLQVFPLLTFAYSAQMSMVATNSQTCSTVHERISVISAK